MKNSKIKRPTPSAEMMAKPGMLRSFVDLFYASSDAKMWINEELYEFGCIHHDEFPNKAVLVVNDLYNRDEIVEFVNETAKSWKEVAPL